MRTATDKIVRASIAAAIASAGLAACSLFVPFDDYYRGSGPADACADAGCDAREPLDAGTCDADLQKDSRHCGACDHSCLGGDCNAGLCPVDTVFAKTPLLYAAGLAIDERSVYLACGTPTAGAEGALVRVGKADLEVAPIASTGAAAFRVVATDTELFWTQGGIVDAGAPSRGIGRTSKVPAGGTFVDPFVGNQTGPYALAVDDATAFWTNFLLGGGDVWRAARSGAPTARSIAAAQSAAGVAVDGTHVYWTTTLPVGAVQRASKDGSNAMKIATNQTFPFAIFVDGESVYWTGFAAGGSVVRLAKAGGMPVELATSQDHPNAVVADGAYVYWSNAGPVGSNNLGTINRVSKAGGKSIVLAVLTAPSDLAVDGVNVYWASQGSVFRVAK